ncbi:hypothetical protein D5086_031396 [Populus alba]|uniref:Uncharacterized protein n=1 Tax=Populus alba TaxID=43335 RepID=A0ACC4AIF4_POPAL
MSKIGGEKNLAPGVKQALKKAIPNSKVVMNRAKRGLFAGRHIQFGNQISEDGGNKSRRSWKPNVQDKRLFSYILDRHVRVKVTTHAIRCIDKAGGIDEYLLKTPYHKMDTEMGILWKAKIEKLYEELGNMEVVFFTPEAEAELDQDFKDMRLEQREARKQLRRQIYGCKKTELKMGKQKWSVLGPLKRAVKKINFLLNYRKWRLASSILWNASSSSSSGTMRRLSFNDRIGLHGVIEDVQSDHQSKPVRALERARSHGSSSDDDVDKRAEIFITNFRRQLLMERQVSLQLRFPKNLSQNLPSLSTQNPISCSPFSLQVSNSRSSPLRAAASSSTVVDTTTNAPVSSTNSNVAFNVIEEELRQSLEAVFSKIWSQTIAAASLG